jgi:hypothetical protein
MPKYVYHDYVKTVTTRFEAALSEIQAIHNFDYGPEFEIAICKILRLALPEQYGVCRGHVINAQGESAGDDIIIYDTIRFPTLRLHAKNDYAQKEWIPIEAAYAYIEAKHTVNLEGSDGSSLEKVCNQVCAVKGLCEQREPVLPSYINQHVTLGGNAVKFTTPQDFPQIKNPMYGMILSRNVREKKDGRVLTDPLEIHDKAIRRRIGLVNGINPDAVVLGNEVIALPLIGQEGVSRRLASPFYVPGISHLNVVPVPQIAFGVGLCLLHFALDWIQLDKMPWSRIIIDSFNAGK